MCIAIAILRSQFLYLGVLGAHHLLAILPKAIPLGSIGSNPQSQAGTNVDRIKSKTELDWSHFENNIENRCPIVTCLFEDLIHLRVYP
jgi:hypothetical protein